MNYQNKTVYWLVLAHIIIISLSNALVQYPFDLLGYKTTWGAFVYPIIFILTDLTTRLAGQRKARKTILLAMVPGLVCSYFIANFYKEGDLLVINSVALRIAFASFFAYVVGQQLDITIFQRFRQKQQWWVAPIVSNIFGNLFDTYAFFFIAFYQCSNSFLSSHWLEIATFDLIFKLVISLLTFIPLYGVILRLLFANSASGFAKIPLEK
ncbi:MAG: 7-cyano-7-deazaguanine/7-aminomethyl-7-deazaguanine transporter [Tatlockia sp.]|nr:7-cyano-7-deazaguanine/7-aminomethyl-7-deazaguanine transporter [Tatlockia sp.]